MQHPMIQLENDDAQPCMMGFNKIRCCRFFISGHFGMENGVDSSVCVVSSTAVERSTNYVKHDGQESVSKLKRICGLCKGLLKQRPIIQNRHIRGRSSGG